MRAEKWLLSGHLYVTMPGVSLIRILFPQVLQRCVLLRIRTILMMTAMITDIPTTISGITGGLS